MMEHIIYKITNSLNNRFYIGMHSTKNVNDGYLGSGRRIKAEVKKYGKENFVKEILQYLPTREALKTRETEIVCDALLENPLCLNLKNGGEGGWDHITDEQIKKWHLSGSSLGGKAATAKLTKETRQQNAKKGFVTKILNGSPFGFAGNKHSDEAKAKIGEKNKQMTGERNSQFGSCWVTDGVKPVKIKKEQLDEFLAKGFRRGRTIGV